MEPINKRYEFILLFDVKNGNPNGDPDAGNAPRIDPETGHGFVSDVCLKRKIRNYICLAKGAATGQPEEGYDIYVKEKAILNRQHERPYESPELKNAPKGADKTALARKWMCQTFFDVRMFGAVMSTGAKDKQCGQVRGPVQLAFAYSVDPIASLEQALTRVAVTTEEKAKEQIKKHGQIQPEMGRKEIVPYALYVAHGYISPFLAADTGFSDQDLQLLWEALKNMFEHDHSAARGEMASRKLYVFEHATPLGNAPAHTLFERLHVERADSDRPARAFTDYRIRLDWDNPPDGVTRHELL